MDNADRANEVSTASVSVVIPGRNEAATITRVIERVTELPCVKEVLVVDNGSTDDTAKVARAAGARVVSEPQPGMGYAVRTGFLAAAHDWVMKVDADLDRFDVARFGAMCAARRDGVGMVKGNWSDPNDNKPMTRLLVSPAVARLAPRLKDLPSVNSGIYLADRRCFAASELVGSYAVDVDVMLRVYAFGADIVEVDIGALEHDQRSVGHYSGMAHELSNFFFDRAAQEPLHEWLVLNDDTPLPAEMSAFLQARGRLGGRVTLTCTDPVRAGIKDLLRFPTVTLTTLEEYRPAVTSSQLYIAVGAEAGLELISQAQTLAQSTAIHASVLQMVSAAGDAFTLSVPHAEQITSAHFKRL